MLKPNRIIFIILLISIFGCGTVQNQSNGQVFNKKSEKGYYQVSLFPNLHPLPLRKIHSWTVQILKTDLQPIENADIFVYGGMPSHQHDFPTTPQIIKKMAKGKYLVDGIKFSMFGEWQIRFTIIEKDQRDFVSFDIHL